jgi:hypothetical protein
MSNSFVSKIRSYSTASTGHKLYEKATKCQEASIAILDALSRPDVNIDDQLVCLEQFIANFPEEQAQKQVSMVLDQWTSSKLEMPLSTRLRAIVLGVLYYCEAELLLKAEALYYKTKRQYKFKGNVLVYETLLTRSGRHKQIASIELVFKSWKEDFGLTYSYQTPEISSDLNPKQRSLNDVGDTHRQPPTNFFEYIKDDIHAQNVTHLFATTMRAATKAKSLEFAVSVFEESLLVIKDSIPLYEVMVECFCNLNRVENAYQLLFSMEKGSALSAVHTVLDACARLKNYHLSERVFYDIRTSFHMTPTVDSWNRLLKVYVFREEMDFAHERFIDMLKTKENTRPNLETYEMMIAGHVRAKDAARALEMLKHAKSNNLMQISSLMYAWVMEGHLHAKQYDEMFAIIQEMQDLSLPLPHKFQNLLIRKCRRVDGLLPRYEDFFGPAPEPFDDLKDVREHAEAARRYEEETKKIAKLRKLAKKAGTDGISTTKQNMAVADDAFTEEEMAKVGDDEVVETNEIASHLAEESHAIPSEERGQTPTEQYGMLEEIVEDDAEVSKEEWMKGDIGEHGWKDFSLPEQTTSSTGAKKKKSKLAHMVNLRYKDVFEVAKWKDGSDLDGSVAVREWQILSDPFSKTRPHVVERRKAVERAAAQIESLEQEVIEKIDAQTAREKLKQQRRREKAYGQTRKYIDDPKKLRKRGEKEGLTQPPPGATFSFR